MLNPKQAAFCAEYVASGVARTAYQQVYQCTEHSARVNAAKLMRRADIRERIEELQREMCTERIASATEIQQRLTRIARREETETVYLPNGSQVQRAAPIRESLKALELLAKMKGLFITRQEIDLQSVVKKIIIKQKVNKDLIFIKKILHILLT